MIINLLLTIWILLIPTCLPYPFSQSDDGDENPSSTSNNHNLGSFSNVYGRPSLYPIIRTNQGTRHFLEKAQSSPLSAPVKSSDHYNHKWRPKSYICNKSSPLGMQSGVIKNDQITASSTYNEQSVGPRFSRFNKDESGGAWCPKAQLNQDTSGTEWIQVNLTDRYVITSVATQGRFGNGNGREYLEEYFIEYSRDFGATWTRWKTSKGQTHLKGNNDTYSNVTNALDLPIVGANMIRIFPFAKHYRTVCLRFELFGCPYKDGPLSYSMPDGAFGGRYGDLIDDSYDGIRDQRKYLSGGLGQLVDGIKAHEDYKVNSGYEWIGWEAGNETVEIIFEFGELRNFSSVMLFTHNLFSKHIEVFSSARIYFSFDGIRWSKSPLTMEYQPDHITESPRDVIINLGNKVSKYIKFSLKFASKFLLVSEVKFNSFPVTGDYNLLMDDLESLEVTQDPVEPDDQGGPSSLVSILIIVFSLIVIIVCAIGSFYLYRRHFHGRIKTDHFLTIGTNYLDSIGDPCKGATTPVYCDPDEINNYHNRGGNHNPHHLLLQQQQLTLLHQSQQQNHQQLRYDHEYAVPDVCNYPNGNGSVNNKKTKHLISNPLSNLDKFVKDTNYVNYSKHNNVIIGDNNSCDYNDLKPLADKSDHEPTLIKVNNGTTLINGLANSTSVNNSVVLPPPPPQSDGITDDEDDDDDQDDHPSKAMNPLIDINHMYLLKQNNLHHHNHQPSPHHHAHHQQQQISSTSSSPNNLNTSTTTISNSSLSPSPKYGTITTANQRFLTSSNVNKQRQGGYRAVAMSTSTGRRDRR